MEVPAQPPLGCVLPGLRLSVDHEEGFGAPGPFGVPPGQQRLVERHCSSVLYSGWFSFCS
jgi:hypothetical protein